MEHEARAIADAARTADAKEGIAAFFDKRAPEFGGK
jgi:2-(1,2-epoxy-1,2-dihydrophenyl)acetyl-CoA isomerase